MQVNELHTVSIFHRLLFLGWLGDDFYPFALKHANVVTIAIKQFHVEHEMLAFVRV